MVVRTAGPWARGGALQFLFIILACIIPDMVTTSITEFNGDLVSGDFNGRYFFIPQLLDDFTLKSLPLHGEFKNPREFLIGTGVRVYCFPNAIAGA